MYYVSVVHVSRVVMDTNDRMLRKISIGQAKTEEGFGRDVSTPHNIQLFVFETIE